MIHSVYMHHVHITTIRIELRLDLNFYIPKSVSGVEYHSDHVFPVLLLVLIGEI